MSNRITDHDAKAPQGTTADNDHLSAGDFAMLGIHDFAYIRKVANPENDADMSAFGVFTADGTHIASFESHAIASAAIRQHDMEPRSVH